MAIAEVSLVLSALVTAASAGYALAERRASKVRSAARAARKKKKRTKSAPPALAKRPSLPIVRLTYDEDDDGELTQVGGAESQPAVVEPIIYDADAAVDEPTGARSMFILSATAHSDRGRRRKRNEDSMLVDEAQHLFAVADGMGGYKGGDVASGLAVQAIKDTFASATHAAARPGVSRDGMRLAEAIQAANIQILGTAKRERLEGMGTTVCAARFAPNKRRLFIGHVGDSRCYRMRGGQLSQMTADHVMRDLGVTGAGADNLSRAVGIWPTVPIDVISATPLPDDVYLLCSDGLTKMVPDVDIAWILACESDPQVAVDRLIDKANANGGKDNVTVIVARVVGLPAAAGEPIVARA